MTGVTVNLTCHGCDTAVSVPAEGCVVIHDPATDEYLLETVCPTCRLLTECRPSEDQATAILDGGAILAIPQPR